MKTNFLCRNTLPRGSCVFLKMMVTVTALLCSHLCAYAQPMQTAPLDGADVTVPVELEWTSSSTQGTDIEVYECATPPANTNTVDLGAYELLCDPITISQVPEDLSGVTYNPLTNTLFMVRNSSGAETIYETTLSGKWLRTITLSSEFDDTEGIVHIGGTEYAVTEERVGKVTLININALTSNVNHSNSTVLQLPGTWSGNDGLEGISYNPNDSKIHTLKERTSKAYYSFSKSASSPLTNNDVNEPCGTNPFSSLSDLAGMHHLGLTNLPNLNVSTHTLILSQESRTVIEIDENCNQKSQILLSANGANGTLSTAVPQPEGVTMDNNGNLYIVSEPNLLYIFAKPNTGTLIHGATAVTGNSYEIPVSLQTGVDYCWRVKNNDECTWSPLWSFTPVELCSSTSVQSCNDNDPCTINDQREVSTFDGSICVPCAGTLDAGSCHATCTTTQACDDGNPCTTGDVETIAANGSVCVPCMGTLDTAGCDAACSTTQTCNDGDPLTINDMETLAADGTVCSACAGMPVNACSDTSVQTCDDGNPCTLNDEQIVSNLDGTICMPCMGTTNPSSCDAACTTTQTCDDGNPLTINDMETLAANGTVCSACIGTPVEPCSDTSVQSCDDGNPCTEGDIETVSNLDGSVCVPCMGQTNPSSCDAACTTTQACNDGTYCTTNDTQTVAADGSICVPCAGVPDSGSCAGACTTAVACDDGSPCTENDVEVIAEDGSVCVPCKGVLNESSCHLDCVVYYTCDDEDPLTVNDMVALAADASQICIPCAGTYDPNACIEDISISTYDVNQTYYEVSNTITTILDANVEVNNGEQFTLNAGYYVKLTPGFKAKTGSIVRAYIEGCEPNSQKVEQTTLASVKHYPNPFKDEVTLEFSLDADAEVQIIISDVNGRTVQQLQVDNLSRGIQSHSISTEDWISGIYFYQVQIKEQNTGILSHANGTLVKM